MRIYKKINVFDEALNRIRYLFDEFPNVIVNISGGKDSTVVFNLAMIVAKEKNRLPLTVSFIDQEAEWDIVIEHIRSIMYKKDVNPRWYQMPIKIFNATSGIDHWLMCWKEGKKWIREKEPISINKNIYGTDRFAKLFGAIIRKENPTIKTCYLAGVRTEESPARQLGLTSRPTYKWITYGTVETKKLDHYAFYPIYDWSYTDVWKAIHDNKWDYCKLYDLMYQYGIKTQNMRVSNVHHETAVYALFFMQEIEPDNYERLTQRISGIDMAGKMGKDDYFIKDLPYMFKDWKEYRDFLLEKLIDNQKWKDGFRRIFSRQEKVFYNSIGDNLFKVHINSILTNDWEYIKLKNFASTPEMRFIAKKYKENYDN